MTNASIRRLIGGIGALLVFLICGALIVLHFVFKWNVQKIDVTDYINIYSTDGDYKAEVDTDRMIAGERLKNPTPEEEKQYPEITVLRNLVVSISQQGDVYTLEVQVKKDSVAGDANAILKKAGLSLTNLKWQLTGSEMAKRSMPLPAQTQEPSQSGQAPAPGSQTSTPEPEPTKPVLNVSDYVCTSRPEDGDYTAALDVARMLNDAGLPLTADPETNLEARVLRSLTLQVKKTDDGYSFETASYLTTVADDLKRAGFELKNLKWSWTEAEMAAHQGTPAALPDPVAQSGQTTPQPTKAVLELPQYVRTYRMENGELGAKLDTYQMFVDAGVAPTADPDTNLRAQILRSLGVSMKKTEDGYQFQTTSMMEAVMEALQNADMQIKSTQWTWTEAEAEAHAGTVTPLPAPVRETTPAPETPAPETPAPTGGETDQAPETPAPTGSASRNPNAIITLYGFDQTEVRKAIRAAKEQRYGSSIESSEVKYNYFAIGNTSALHGNVFRLVYKITTSGGSIEYLIADVYDLERETGYTMNDVHLSVETDRNTARSTTDLADYTVYTLNEGSMPFPENSGKSPFNSDGLVMPKSLTEQLTCDELWDIPASDEMTLHKLLGYARNEMFAQGGLQFGEGTNYLRHFSQYSWYHPVGQVSVSDLASQYPVTSKNIETIKFLEKLIKEG